MQQARKKRGTAIENGAAVLMARIVDRNGVPIRRSEVAAIEHSVFERDPRRRKRRAMVAGHERIVLCVEDVLFDSLQMGGLWSLDVAGYNFRHEFEIDDAARFLEAGAMYEILYLFTTTCGDKVAIRLDLGVIEQ